MLSVAHIKYEVVEQDNFVQKLLEYPNHCDVAFDYETYNDVHGDLAAEPWDENTAPFMFSVCTLDDPENTLKVFNFRELTKEQKTTFEWFLTSRHVWAFNCKFEGAVTWRILGKIIKFDDVQCLYKVQGGFINELSLKKGTAKLFNVTEWADATWETLSALRDIVSRVQNKYVKKGKERNWQNKTNDWVNAFLEGNVKRIYDLVEIANCSPDKITKQDAEFIVSLKHARPHLTPSVVLNALTKSGMDADKVNLLYVPKQVVERYCAYDALATAYNYQKLYDGCAKQYYIYIRQSWLAMLMEAYGMTRDLNRETEIESHYQEQILHYMKEMLSIPEFTSTVEIKYVENRVNPESGRLKNFIETRTGFEIEDTRKVQESSDYEELKETYWNYNSTHKNELRVFYDALFSSDMMMSAVVAYHIKKYLVQLEGFSETIDGQEISKAKKIRWNNIAELYPDAVNHIARNLHSAKTTEERNKWAKINFNLEKTYQEAITLNVAPTQGERKKLADIEDIRMSLKKENVEILFSALSECADMNPDAPWDTLTWEMRMVFCCKIIKKLDKALTSWVRGKVGRDRVRSCQFGESLLDVPQRTASGESYLFQTSFNDCSAETKRWKSPVHAIPRGCELSEMIIPRYDDSILVHYDYCWHKDTKIRLLYSKRVMTVENLYEDYITKCHELGHHVTYRVFSYDPFRPAITEGTIVDVRRVRREPFLIEIELENGYKLQMTEEHNLNKQGYIKTKARDLHVGDVLMALHSMGLAIKSISKVPYDDWVYTIETAEMWHNYYVIAEDNGPDSILSSNSQAEVRVIASLSQENNLIKLFRDNPKADVHRLMASKVWNKNPEDVSGEERRASKACCLSGDTRVRLLDGTVKTLKDLEGKTDFYVYTVNQENGEMEPGKVTWCGKVKTAQKYVKITLDDGGVIRMDLNHQIVRKDGIGVSGHDLKAGDLLQSIETGINRNGLLGLKGYEYVVNPNGTRRTIYRQVCLQNNEYKYGYAVHHKDHNIFNNCPDNLDYLTKTEHTTHHSQCKSKLHAWGGFVIWDDKRRKTISDMMIEEQQDFRNSRGYVGATSAILRYIRNLLENGFVDNIADVYNKYRTAHLICRWENLPKVFDASHYDIIQNAWHIKWDSSETHAVKELDTSHCSAQGKAHMKHLWESGDPDAVEYRKQHAKRQKKTMAGINQRSEIIEIQQQCKILKALKMLNVHCNDYDIINSYEQCRNLNKLNQWIQRAPKHAQIVRHFGTIENALQKSKSYTNHEIRSVEIVEESIDLYDMTVPGNNNYWILTSEDGAGKYSGVIHLNTFGILYGMNTESLANSHFKGNVTAAKSVVSRFYEAYPNILKWCNERHSQVDRHGYVNTLFGDKIYIESKSRGERHRRSQNYPVQSTSSNLAGYGIWGVWEACRADGIEAIPQCFIHDSSDWDVRLPDLLRFMKIVNKCAIDDINTEFGIPMKIDFEIGINLNFTMHIENPEFTENGVKFSFKSPEVFYKRLIQSLRIIYNIKGEITDSYPETESWANIFVTKRPYSMYLNRPIEIYEGDIVLTHKT